MKLITKELMNKIPPIEGQNVTKLEDYKLYCKLFSPFSCWTWYIAEADFENGICFGYIEGFENEWGDFSLCELQELAQRGGVYTIERDKWFDPCLFKDLKK